MNGRGEIDARPREYMHARRDLERERTFKLYYATGTLLLVRGKHNTARSTAGIEKLCASLNETASRPKTSLRAFLRVPKTLTFPSR